VAGFQVTTSGRFWVIAKGMDLQQVMQAGRSGFIYTAGSISIALLLGLGLGRLLRVGQRVSYLISAGTAICGGSAIAAIAPITDATQDEIGVSLGTVFVLNSVALLAFPTIGLALHMTQTQFGLWAALSIHDISSVVGATAKYGASALAVGTTVKLARALWIVPLSVGTAIAKKSKARIQWPWFILFFCMAAVANTYLPLLRPVYPVLRHLGVIGLTVTLYLIGTGLSMRTIREVGARPLLQGIVLWLAVAGGSLRMPMQGSIICTAMAPFMKLPAGRMHAASFTRSMLSTHRLQQPRRWRGSALSMQSKTRYAATRQI
jgi:uncharacterized integral membrane protein (TIGR00698 family)